MKAPTSKIRFSTASTLLDYGFSNFEYKSLAAKNQTVKSINVSKGILPQVEAVAENDCGAILAKGADINIEQNISISDDAVLNGISAPILKNQVIGKISFYLNGDLISECNLIAKDDVQKIGILSMEKLIIGNWFKVLR